MQNKLALLYLRRLIRKVTSISISSGVSVNLCLAIRKTKRLINCLSLLLHKLPAQSLYDMPTPIRY